MKNLINNSTYLEELKTVRWYVVPINAERFFYSVLRREYNIYQVFCNKLLYGLSAGYIHTLIKINFTWRI